MAEATICIIEDMDQVRAMVSDVLEHAGFEVYGAADGLSGVALVKRVEPDLVVLDIGLPGGVPGTSVCQQLRADPKTARVGIVALTGNVDDESERAMFAAGADDYIKKQNFKPDILVSRVRAVLRRLHPAPAEKMEVGPLAIDPARRIALLGGTALSLTPTEFDIVYRLVSNPDRALSRSELLDRGAPTSVDRTVNVHVMAIRRKLGSHAWLVKTVYGHGYRLGTGPEDADSD